MATRNTRTKKEPTTTVETWTPAQAKEALAENHVNRNLREYQVNKYARDMKEGRWTFCAEPIAFDVTGKLINGQHRLNAQIQADVKVQWIVLRDAPVEAQKTMDIGAKRSLTDLLHFEGVSHANTIGAVAKLAIQMQSGMIYVTRTASQLSNSEILEFIQKNEEVLLHSTKAGLAAGNNGFLRTKPSALAAAHWWITKHVGIQEADDFFDRIARMTNEPEGSAVIALVKRLNELQKNKIRIEPRWVVYMVLKAWNYDVRREPVYKLTSQTKTGEYKLLMPLPRDTKSVGTSSDDDE